MAWPVRTTKTLVVLTTVLLPFSASARSLKAYIENSAGLFHFQAKQYFPAYNDFLRALEQDPYNPDLHMNLGLTFEMNEEYEKAEKAYLSAEQLAGEDKARQFLALFNMAGVRAKKEDVDGALQAYQAALEIEPESLEVKTNIELLFQQQQGKGKSNQDKKNGKGKDDKDQSKDQNQDDKDKNKDKDQNKDKQYEQPKKQPQSFQSKDLSKDDVRKILDEIQSQEKSIRAKELDKGAKERKNDKDW
jgi:Ca-activated chloride channel homolog